MWRSDFCIGAVRGWKELDWTVLDSVTKSCEIQTGELCFVMMSVGVGWTFGIFRDVAKFKLRERKINELCKSCCWFMSAEYNLKIFCIGLNN